MKHFIMAFVVLIGSGCTPELNQQDWSADPYAVRDSAGVEIVESLGAVVRARRFAVVDPAAFLQIGTEGIPEYEFAGISGVAQLKDGTIAVVDAGSSELRFFTRTGEFLRARGGRGEGPGEFMRAVLVPLPIYDSLPVYDSRLRRLSVFDPLATVAPRVRQIPVVGRLVGLTRDGVLIQTSTTYMGYQAGPDPEPEPNDVVLLRAAGDAVQIGRFSGRHGFVNITSGGQVNLHDIPFHFNPTAVADEDGFYLNPAEGPDIHRYDAAGNLVRIIRLKEDVRRGTEAARDSVVNAAITRRGLQGSAAEWLRDTYRQMPLRAIIPTFSELHTDEEGMLWAEVFRSNPAAAPLWIIFSSDGKALGTAILPSGLVVRQIGSDYVLGTWRDANDVEYVRKYALARLSQRGNSVNLEEQ